MEGWGATWTDKIISFKYGVTDESVTHHRGKIVEFIWIYDIKKASGEVVRKNETELNDVTTKLTPDTSVSWKEQQYRGTIEDGTITETGIVTSVIPGYKIREYGSNNIIIKPTAELTYLGPEKERLYADTREALAGQLLEKKKANTAAEEAKAKRLEVAKIEAALRYNNAEFIKTQNEAFLKKIQTLEEWLPEATKEAEAAEVIAKKLAATKSLARFPASRVLPTGGGKRRTKRGRRRSLKVTYRRSKQ